MFKFILSTFIVFTFTLVDNAFSLEITERTLGTINSINNGFGTIEECGNSHENIGCDRGTVDNILESILDLTTQNQCIASRDEFDRMGIDIPECPGPGESLRGLDHSYPSGGMFALYTGDNSGFLQDLVTEYLDDSPAGTFNLVLPRTHINELESDSALVEVINNSRVNIIMVETMPAVKRWMQDSFVFGTLDEKPAIYQLDHFAETGRQLEDRLACQIAKSCDVPYLVPPDMVDPTNSNQNSLNSGGNLEVLPGGTVYRGTIQSDGFGGRHLEPNAQIPFETSAQRIQREALEEAGNRVLDIDVSFLQVGHVDEIVSVVQTDRASPCDFAVLLASPEKAFELMETEAQASGGDSTSSETSSGYLNNFRSFFMAEAHAGATSLAARRRSDDPRDESCRETSYTQLATEGATQRINPQRVEEIYNSNCMNGRHISSFVESDDYEILKRTNLEGSLPERPSITSIMQRNRELILTELTETTGCEEIPVVDVPVFFQGGLSYAPDLVNGVVHTNANNTSSIIMPRTYFRPFDDYMEEELSKLGVGSIFVHSVGYHNLQGQVHCGTNTARICK